jgi:hypothetical protein
MTEYTEHWKYRPAVNRMRKEELFQYATYTAVYGYKRISSLLPSLRRSLKATVPPVSAAFAARLCGLQANRSLASQRYKTPQRIL